MLRFLLPIIMFALASCETDSGAGGWTSSEAWIARSSTDPITGIERCTVLAPDRGLSGAYTRSMSLYPFVERNSEVGLLVGVSSGGQIRVPPGDIQWRVDDNQYRTLLQSRTPVFGNPASVVDTSGMTPEMQAALAASQAMTAGLMSSIQNGITAAGGDLAAEMLSEMRAGSGLLYRSSAAAPNAGVPSAATNRVGQYSNGGLRPFPLDASFHAALEQCGL